MPRSQGEFDARAKVHYLVSSSSVAAVDFYDELHSMVEMRKNFRNMYYLENSKTRLTAMEVLALIYSSNNDQNATAAMFNGFKTEIASILNKSNDNLNNPEIVISEELSKQVMKSIPVMTNERDVKYWQLRL